MSMDVDLQAKVYVVACYSGMQQKVRDEKNNILRNINEVFIAFNGFKKGEAHEKEHGNC